MQSPVPRSRSSAPPLQTGRPKSDAVVCGVGARTHAGLNALQATLATRANKMRARECHLIDRFGEPMSMCRLASIGDNVQGLPRFVALGAPALMQAAWPWRETFLSMQRDPEPLAVIVALPSQTRPGFDARLERDLLPALQERTGIVLDERRSSVVCGDRGGAVRAFRDAVDLLDEGIVDQVAVGGIDSYFDPDVLEWLDAELRLHSLEAENGFIPGEAAGFLLLTHRAKASGLRKIASIVGTAVEDEPRPYGHAEPCQAIAMSHAIKRAAGPLERAQRIPWVLTDVANERHRVNEWLIAYGRCYRAFRDDVLHDQPLLKTGDVGAASTALLAAMVSVQWEIGCAHGDVAMVATSSDGPERGVMVMAKEEP